MLNEEELGTKKSEIEETVEKALKKEHPNYEDEFKITIVSADAADINHANVQNLVNAIYYIYLQSPADVCTKLYILVRQFAKAFKEDSYMEQLDNLWEGGKKHKLVIPTIETMVIRDMSNPYFIMGKRYNQGRGTTYTLGELNLRIQFTKRRIFDIFCEIYLKNDVTEPFVMPSQILEAGAKDVMPSL